MSQTRRWFLRSAGAATLAIPALPSLLSSREAAAQTAVRPRCFIGIMGAYGGCWAERFFPPMSTGAVTQTYAGRTIRSQALAATVAGGQTRLSDVLQAGSGTLTPSLVGKMNLLQGIDLPFDVNHHSAATFGNYAQGDAAIAGGSTPTGISGQALVGHPRSTIDQVLAASPTFYGELGSVVRRSLYVSTFGSLSYGYPGGGEGKSLNSGEVLPSTSVAQAWDQLFAGFNATKPPRAPVVDLVLEDYRRLRAHPRLSRLDRQRLDEHLTRIEEIQRRLQVVAPAQCQVPARAASTPAVNADPASHAAFYDAFRDVVVAALQCGLTRVVSYLFQGWDTTFDGLSQDPFHQLVSHRVDEQAAQTAMCESRRLMFSKMIVPLAAALDATRDPDGSSLLDRTLLYFTQEHGTYGHCQQNIPVVTFGGAGGAVRTGLHVDYRDLTRQLPQHYDESIVTGRPYVGLTYHQLLGSMLQWLGVPRTEWGGPQNGGEPNHRGYGFRPPDVTPRQSHWRDGVEWAVAGERLPVVSK
ncbi:MAG: DUF1552 domain-containing protein [Archangiaceae bacterium]|nr:DUF1552 domain-containing protein [Archangiaceae bacterium]